MSTLENYYLPGDLQNQIEAFVVRSALVLGRHPDDPSVRAVVHIKCNYAPEGAAILFTLVTGMGAKTPKIRWLETDDTLSAEQLLARVPGDRGRPSAERDVAKQFLMAELEDGPRTKASMQRAAEARSISAMTLRRAAEDLGVKRVRSGGKTMWSLGSTDRRVAHKSAT